MQFLVVGLAFKRQLIVTKVDLTLSNNLVDNTVHVISSCAYGYIRIIKILQQSLPVRLRTHQQGPYRNMGWSLLQMLDNRMIFRLHCSPEFLCLTLAYYPFSLILLLTSESKLLMIITSSLSGHPWCITSLLPIVFVCQESLVAQR